MIKRHVLKKISGTKKDQSPWFAIVLAASFSNGVLYRERMEFVPKEIWDMMEEDTDIQVNKD